MLTVVAWSLEIEIQFYLLAPFLFRLLALHKHIRRTLLTIAIVTLIIIQVLYIPTFLSIYGFAQYFLIGILLADFYVSDAAATIFKGNWVVPAAIICLIAIIYLPINAKDVSNIELVLIRLGFLLSIGILYYAILKNSALKTIFSFKFIPIIGGMCYSIYLLHYTIISILGRLTLKMHITSYYLPNLVLQIILLSIPILIISSIFYLYVERPFMSSKWVDKLMKKDKHLETTNMPPPQG